MKISEQVERVDGRDKCKGRTRYLEDIPFDGYYARTLRSPIPKGKIIKINYPQDDDIIVIHGGLEGFRNEIAMIDTAMPAFATEEVNYYGEPIALLLGRDKTKLLAYEKQVDLSLEEERGIHDLEHSQEHFTRQRFTKGSLDKLDYDELFERTYQTGYQEQLYMEKQGVIGQMIGDKVQVKGSLQCPYYVHNAICHALDLEKDKVQVIQSPTGGAFGGKEEYPSLIAVQVAIASYLTNKPVQLVFDRREDMMYTTKRHPSKSKIKTYLKNKKIVGMTFEIDLDAGPYLGLSDVVLQRSILTLMGIYKIDNLEVIGRTIKTNNVFTGAFRGFGAPQSMYALELHMTHLAKALNKSQLAFRAEYFVKKGDTSSTGGFYQEDIFLEDMKDKLMALSAPLYRDTKDKLVGYGYSMIPHGGGFTGDGEATHIKASVELSRLANGQVEILVSNVEMGQGAKTALSKIVASALELEIEQVIYEDPDTDRVPDSGPTVASRTTMVVGGLLYEAAKELASRPGEVITVTKDFKQPDYVKWNQEKLEGNAYMVYSWAALMARVEIDPISYEVTCTDLAGVYDVGVPIDEKLFLGQVHGGVVQGLGYGLMEHMSSQDGKILQNSFSAYSIPTTMDIPNIHTAWIENKYLDGPFGAKSVGELTLVGVAPALAAAVEDALKKEFHQIPLLPEILKRGEDDYA